MRLQERAYQCLKDEITSYRLRPGTAIREMDISQQLGMSRTPIREAIKQLESEGLVVTHPFKGAIITPITPYDVEEIYSLRLLLEVFALERSINYITDSELDYVKNLFETANRIGDDWELFFKADRTFHQLIVEKSGSKRLVIFLNNMNAQIERIRYYGSQGKNRLSSFNEHMKIIEKIRARDLEGSKQALSEHLLSITKAAIEISKTMMTEVF